MNNISLCCRLVVKQDFVLCMSVSFFALQLALIPICICNNRCTFQIPNSNGKHPKLYDLYVLCFHSVDLYHLLSGISGLNCFLSKAINYKKDLFCKDSYVNQLRPQISIVCANSIEEQCSFMGVLKTQNTSMCAQSQKPMNLFSQSI